MPEWLKNLFAKFDDPQSMLEPTYQTLTKETLRLRRDYSASVAKELNIEKKILIKQNSPEDIASLELELIKQQALSKILNINLQDKEAQVQKVYTKKQVLIARRKTEGGSSNMDPRRATLVIIATMFAWALLGVYLNLKNYLK